MDKLLVRGIAIGIIVSTIVFGLTYYLGDNENSITEKQVDQFLLEAGYKRIALEEYDELQKNKQEEVPPAPKEEPEQSAEQPTEEIVEKTEPSEEEKQEKVIYVLTIESGMYSNDIADKLQKAGIIPDSTTFNQYLVEHDLNKAIQIGTYEVTNEMSVEQIADVITK